MSNDHDHDHDTDSAAPETDTLDDLFDRLIETLSGLGELLSAKAASEGLTERENVLCHEIMERLLELDMAKQDDGSDAVDAAIEHAGGAPIRLGLRRLPHGKLKPGVQVVTSMETLYSIVVIDDHHRIVGLRRTVSAKDRDRILDNLYSNYGIQPDDSHVGVPIRKPVLNYFGKPSDA